MTLSQLSEPKLLIPRLLSDDWMGAIREMTARLESAERISNPAGFLDAVLERELKVPTFVPPGLAFPHARGQAVRTLSLAVGLTQPGFTWGRDRRAVVKVVFLIAVPLGAVETYLRALSALVRFAENETALAGLADCRRPEQMYQILEQVAVPSGTDD